MYTSAHTHAHKTWLQMEGGATRAHTILSLSLSCLLKHTLSLCRQTVHTHAHALRGHHPPHFSPQAGPSVPRGRETERQRKRSVDPVMCVLFTPQLPVLSLSFSLCLHLPFPQFQAANSAVCQLHSQSCEITHKHSFHLYLLQSPS